MRVYPALFLAAALWLAGCGGSGGDNSITGPAPQSHVGTYSLTQVSGVSLPAVFYSNSAGSAWYVSGSAVLRSDGSYEQVLTDSVGYADGTTGGTNTVYENGTYSITGSQITFTIPADANGPALSYTGSVDATTVSYTYDATSYTFRRR